MHVPRPLHSLRSLQLTYTEILSVSRVVLMGIATEFPAFRTAGEAVDGNGRSGKVAVREAAYTTGLELRDEEPLLALTLTLALALTPTPNPTPSPTPNPNPSPNLNPNLNPNPNPNPYP